MTKLDIMEWAGAGSVATAAGMYDMRLGILTAGIWLIWAANAAAIFGRDVTEEADDDTDGQ